MRTGTLSIVLSALGASVLGAPVTAESWSEGSDFRRPLLAEPGPFLASGGNQLLHTSGQCWETGGFPPSDPGDELTIVGVLNDVESPLGWDPANHSYTVWIRGLTSEQEWLLGSVRVVEYSGGRITFYEDSLPSNHSYGIDPPNATAPSTFADGTAYLDGFFFGGGSLTFNDATEYGSIVLEVIFTGGAALPVLPYPCWTFSANIAAVAPEGYDFQMNGDIYYGNDCVASVDPSSWGRVKGLYR
ncbi:MAG: hypothetical protein KC591_12790 [Gemmatimonadetes bacterium]|nr:hypothetical protein [Gemmatimonadota bacterium]